MSVKIAIVGPESSGKSSLARVLAGHFGADLVEEFSREYLNDLGRNYEEGDLVDIVRGQIASEEEVLKTNPGMIICDTIPLDVRVWSLFKYGRCSEALEEAIGTRKYGLQLLMKPDLPWVADPLRENPGNREALFDLFLRELQKTGSPFEIIDGQGPQRTEKAIAAIEFLVN